MNRTIADLMTRDVRTIASGDTVEELERLLAAEGLTGVPVIDGGTLVGVVSRSDLFRQAALERAVDGYVTDWYRTDPMSGADPPDTDATRVAAPSFADQKVAEIMSKPVISIEVSRAVSEAATLMLEHRVHRLVVTDDGSVVGIVTTMDLLQALTPQ